MTSKILRIDHTTNKVRVIAFDSETRAQAFLNTLRERALEVGGSYMCTDNAGAAGLVTLTEGGTVVVEYVWSTFDRPQCFTIDTLAGDEQEDACPTVVQEEAPPPRASATQLRRVRKRYASEDIAVDDDARVSEAAEGDWIAAWLWLPAKED